VGWFFIETDPAMTVKVLEHANSATYASRGQAVFPVRGLNRFGFLVALDQGILDEHGEHERLRDFAAQTIEPLLHLDHLATAVFASLVAAKASPALVGEAFGAGIMHDIGGIFLQLHLQERYVQVTERMEELYEPVLEAEQQVFKTDHTAVGRWIAEKWKLPQSMTDAIWLHHHTAAALEAFKDNTRLVVIVALANILAHSTLMDSPRVMTREKQRQLGLQEMLGLGDKEM